MSDSVADVVLCIRWVFAYLFVGAALRAAPDARAIQLGLQSWTCRNWSFDQVVRFAEEQHITYLQLYDQHLDPFASAEVIRARKEQLERHGLIPYAFGVVTLSRDHDNNRRIFEFARSLGVRILVADFEGNDAWDEIERDVKEFDIQVAIHNHGPGSAHANPLELKQALEGRDRRLGLCLDIGWLTASGLDAATVFRECHERVFDMHFKDKRQRGSGQWVDTFIGQGKTRYDDLFAAMTELHWQGVMAIETDDSAFAHAPGAFVAAARTFFEAELTKQRR